jgi:hypothetical protein
MKNGCCEDSSFWYYAAHFGKFYILLWKIDNGCPRDNTNTSITPLRLVIGICVPPADNNELAPVG